MKAEAAAEVAVAGAAAAATTTGPASGRRMAARKQKEKDACKGKDTAKQGTETNARKEKDTAKPAQKGTALRNAALKRKAALKKAKGKPAAKPAAKEEPPKPAAKGKAKAKAKCQSARGHLTSFQGLKRTGKIMSFNRSIKPGRKSNSGEGGSKAPPEVMKECAEDKDKKRKWCDKFCNSENGEWVQITATERIEEEEAQAGESERQWMFPHEMDNKFGAKLSPLYQKQLSVLQDNEGKTDDPEYRRIHPDFQKETDSKVLAVAKQFNVLAVDEQTDTKERQGV